MLKKLRALWRAHKTKLTGYVITVVGALQAASLHLSALLSARAFALVMTLLGLAVAVIGHLNTRAIAKQPPAA